MLTLTPDNKRYADEDGVTYARVSSILKMADYMDDGLIFAGSGMVAKRATEIIGYALRDEPYPRPTVVQNEPAVVSQNIREWDGIQKWLAASPASEMERARNRGNIGDMLAIRFAEEGWLDIRDAGEWAVQTGIDSLMTFDQDDVRRKAGVFSCWWARIQPKPIAWQVRVSDQAGWAGTLDMLAEINNEPYLLDWKFGNYNVVYKKQISAYRFARRVHHEDEDTAKGLAHVKSMAIPALVCIGESRVQFRPISDPLYWFDGFRSAFDMYERLNKKEDSPVSKDLSYTVDTFEAAQL